MSEISQTFPYLGPNDPDSSYLICDGRELERSLYPELFLKIGEAYGAPTPATFNIPDMRGRFPHVLIGHQVGTNRPFTTGHPTRNEPLLVAATPESNGHTHPATPTQVPGHTHEFRSGTVNNSNPGITFHNGRTAQIKGNYWTTDAGAHTHTWAGVKANGDHQHKVTITGGDTETRSRNFAVNYVIRAF